MESIFIDAKWKGEIGFSKEVFVYLSNKRIKSVAILMSIQFLSEANLAKLESEIKAVIPDCKIITPHAKRACNKCQVLGCDSYDDSFSEFSGGSSLAKADLIIYVGDGKFHYTAILLSMMYSGIYDKELLVWNPVNKSMSIYTGKDVLKYKTRIKSKILRFLSAKNVGIMVTMKSGQNHLMLAEKLKKKIEGSNTDRKKVYLFVDNTFDFKHLEDFNFIDCWINTACPRIGQDDEWDSDGKCSILNIKEAMDPELYLGKLG